MYQYSWGKGRLEDDRYLFLICLREQSRDHRVTENDLRARFEADEPSIGTRILAPWPGLIEVLGGTDSFDYAQFLAEYAPHDLHDLENVARAADLVDTPLMVKVDGPNREYVAQRCLAAGIQNFLFADVRSVADAREAVQAVRPEPEGNAGIRMDRRIGYVGAYDTMTRVHEDVVSRGRDAVIALMIEKHGAVENIESILAVEGVDAIVFGPSDYTLSVDIPGKLDAGRVAEAEQRVFTATEEPDVKPIIEIAEPEEADRYMAEYGAQHFNLGVDVSILERWWRTEGQALRDRIET